MKLNPKEYRAVVETAEDIATAETALGIEIDKGALPLRLSLEQTQALAGVAFQTTIGNAPKGASPEVSKALGDFDGLHDAYFVSTLEWYT